MATVGDLDMPAKQCTNTDPFASRTLSTISLKMDEFYFVLKWNDLWVWRTNELSGADKVRQQFLAVRVVDGQPQEMTVLDEFRLRTIGADVHLECDIVILFQADNFKIKYLKTKKKKFRDIWIYRQ